VTDNFNPYQAPKANLEMIEPPGEIVPVGKGKRFATYLIDYLCIYATIFIFGFLVTLIFGQAGLNAVLAINDIVLSLTFYFVYYVFFEGIWARTPAKLILGTVVVTEEGTKPSLRAVLIRTLSRFVPFEPFSFLGERGWHDGFSKTHVISTRG
jgi:uncharacterized RDD family membrane protein YckC